MYLQWLDPQLLPDSAATTLLFEWTGVVFWAVLCVLMLGSFLVPAYGTETAATERARELLRRGQGSPLEWMTTWRGNLHWFAADGQSYVAYRVIGGVALTTGDPVGPRDRLHDTVVGFAEFAAGNGWTPCFYSVSSAVQGGRRRARLERAAGRRGDPARPSRARLHRQEVPGHPHRTEPREEVRRRSGVAAVRVGAARDHRPDHRDLRGVGRRQGPAGDGVHPRRARGGRRSGGAPAGGDRRRSHRARRDLVAAGLRQRPGDGWTLDFMRRRSDGFRPAMEFLIASAATSLKEEGVSVLSLSGAPLAKVPRAARRGRTDTRARAGPPARRPRPHPRADLRVPFAAGVQGEVPAPLRPDVHGLSRTRRPCRASRTRSAARTCPTSRSVRASASCAACSTADPRCAGATGRAGPPTVPWTWRVPIGTTSGRPETGSSMTAASRSKTSRSNSTEITSASATVRDDRALRHDDEVVAVADREVQVVQHHHDRAAQFLVQLVDEVEHLDRVGEVEVGGRLVEQQDVGALCERHRDPGALTLPAGELVESAVGQVGDAGRAAARPRPRPRRRPTTAESRTGAGAGPGRRGRRRSGRRARWGTAAACRGCGRRRGCAWTRSACRRAAPGPPSAATVGRAPAAASTCRTRWAR